MNEKAFKFLVVIMKYNKMQNIHDYKKSLNNNNEKLLNLAIDVIK